MLIPSSRFIKAPFSADMTKEGHFLFFFFFYLLAVLFSDAPEPMTFQLTIASLSSEQSWLVSAHHTGLVECVFCMQCDSRVSVSFLLLFFFVLFYFMGMAAAAGTWRSILPPSMSLLMCVCVLRDTSHVATL